MDHDLRIRICDALIVIADVGEMAQDRQESDANCKGVNQACLDFCRAMTKFAGTPSIEAHVMHERRPN